MGVKDNYLPHVLVKLGICSNNGEARQYIRSKGVLLNGVHTNSCDVVSEGFFDIFNRQFYKLTPNLL